MAQSALFGITPSHASPHLRRWVRITADGQRRGALAHESRARWSRDFRRDWVMPRVRYGGVFDSGATTRLSVWLTGAGYLGVRQ